MKEGRGYQLLVPVKSRKEHEFELLKTNEINPPIKPDQNEDSNFSKMGDISRP